MYEKNRGFHIYKDFWTPVIGVKFWFERRNTVDRCAVSIVKDTYQGKFVKSDHRLVLKRSWRYSSDLPQAGIEVPQPSLLLRIRSLLLFAMNLIRYKEKIEFEFFVN